MRCVKEAAFYSMHTVPNLEVVPEQLDDHNVGNSHAINYAKQELNRLVPHHTKTARITAEFRS
jgi:hypothetical protein